MLRKVLRHLSLLSLGQQSDFGKMPNLLSVFSLTQASETGVGVVPIRQMNEA